jgi:pseudoazurin
MAESRNHVVNVVTDYAGGRMYFEPKVLHVSPGDTVTWINKIAEEHNIITFPDGYPVGAASFHSPLLEKAGDRWSVTFTVEGTYEYHCLPHLPMGMHGMVIVGTPSAQEDFHVPSAVEVAAYRNQMLKWFEDEEEAKYQPREERDNPRAPEVN